MICKMLNLILVRPILCPSKDNTHILTRDPWAILVRGPIRVKFPIKARCHPKVQDTTPGKGRIQDRVPIKDNTLVKVHIQDRFIIWGMVHTPDMGPIKGKVPISLDPDPILGKDNTWGPQQDLTRWGHTPWHLPKGAIWDHRLEVTWDHPLGITWDRHLGVTWDHPLGVTWDHPLEVTWARPLEPTQVDIIRVSNMEE